MSVITIQSHNTEKTICDRTLCPMKQAIRKYCDEGHDVLSAKDMRKALIERPVSGVTASVNKVDESKLSIEAIPIKNFNSFHNFEVEETGLRMRKAYDVGVGKFISFSDILVQNHKQTDLHEEDGFFPFSARTMKEDKRNNSTTQNLACLSVRFQDVAKFLQHSKTLNCT